MIELYHGSPNIIERPVFGKGNTKNDYGLGFYCTKAMKLGKLGIQICIKSEKAFSRLAFREAIPANGEEYYIRRSTRDRKAREDYLKLLEEANTRDAIYIMDIIRQDWKNDDERLQ